MSLALRADANDAPSEEERAGPLGAAAWRALYHRYLPQVYRVAIRMGVPERDCADVCQEVFLRAYRGLSGFRGEAQLSTWLYRITFNEVARHGRGAALRRGLDVLLGRQAAPAPVAAPDDLLARREDARELERVLAGLRPKQRQVFVLFELEELPLSGIADVLGVSLETVRSRLRLARADFERLRRQRDLVAGGKR